MLSDATIPTLARLAALAALLCGGCDAKKNEEQVPAPLAKSSKGSPASRKNPSRTSLALKVYPDMAVPGKDVVLEAAVVPTLVAEIPRFHFQTVSDPCDGELVQDGAKAVYHVPPDCRGAGISIEILAVGTFGEIRRTVKLDIKRTSFMESVVFTYPVPGQKVVSPIPLWWDRTLYQNREESLSFRVKRFDTFILHTGELSADAVVELDIPPSPDSVVLFGETTTGSEETAKLRVYSRQVPEWGGRDQLIDNFELPDVSSLDAKRGVIRDGGKCVVGSAQRIAAEGITPFLYMHYHVSKSKRYGRDEALMGVTEKVPVSITPATHDKLYVWLKGDPVRGPASPVYVRVKGSAGSSRTFKIKRLRDAWRPYHFPLYKALKKSEKLRRVTIFLDAKDVTPPLGTVLMGGMYAHALPERPGDGEDQTAQE